MRTRTERDGGVHMNIGIVALCLALAPAAVLAQEARNPAAESAAMLDTLQRGKQIKGNREQYRHLPEMVAVERDAIETPRQALARVGESSEQLVETKGKVGLVRSPQQKPAFVGRVA